MENANKYSFKITNILFFFFPVALILGNFFTKLNIVFLIIFSLIFYYDKFFKLKINYLDKIILFFFFFTFVTLILNIFENYINAEITSKIIIIKTLYYLRYLALYFTFRMLVEQKILRLDLFCLICFLCAFFVCFDIYFQSFFGKNLFGMVPGTDTGRHNPGVFDTELIAGGYLQKFALFSFFLPFLFLQNKKIKILIHFVFFIFFTFGILLSGNKMPLYLFITSYFIFLLLNYRSWKHLFSTFVVIFIILSLLYKTNEAYKYNFHTFYDHGKLAIHSFFVDDYNDIPEENWSRSYVLEVQCFKYIWKRNPFFGGGLRSYRTVDGGGCNTHPHNYYFEILTDLGLIGLVIILFFLLKLFSQFFVLKNKWIKLKPNILDNRTFPFFLIFIIEFFPLRSSGSFFSTNNASIIFLVLAILVSLVSKKNLNP